MDQRVRAVIAMMQENVQRSLSLNEMAKAVNLSASHLRQLFRRETGRSIRQYLKTLRLAEARRLLRTTFLTVTEVATSVGITDLSHFVRDFKKVYAVTPSRYVARYRSARQKKGSHQRRIVIPANKSADTSTHCHFG